jgi:hypothetical protein
LSTRSARLSAATHPAQYRQLSVPVAMVFSRPSPFLSPTRPTRPRFKPHWLGWPPTWSNSCSGLWFRCAFLRHLLGKCAARVHRHPSAVFLGGAPRWCPAFLQNLNLNINRCADTCDHIPALPGICQAQPAVGCQSHGGDVVCKPHVPCDTTGCWTIKMSERVVYKQWERRATQRAAQRAVRAAPARSPPGKYAHPTRTVWDPHRVRAHAGHTSSSY